MLSNLFIWFYCLPISVVTLFVFLFTVIFQVIWQRLRRFPWARLLWGLIWVGVIGVIIYVTVSGREGSGNYEHFLIPFHTYRALLAGGNIEILRTNYMNAVLFYPAGLMLCSLLPGQWHHWVRILLVTFALCALSCAVEYTQFVLHLGWTEIDDVIHNTLGALLGSIFAIVPLEPWRWIQLVNE